MKRSIAFISDHASPLATLGGKDSGGQNVYVAETVKQLADIGYEIDVFTRWDDIGMPRIVNWMPGIRIIHVKAGPVANIAKEELLPYMDEFTTEMIRFIRKEKRRYELVHAHFFMSALVAMDLKEKLGIPYVVTFHALGQIRRIHQGNNDAFPAERIDIEQKVVHHCDAIIAECPQDKNDLIEYYHADEEKITIIPCGFSAAEFYPVEKSIAREKLKLDISEKILLQLGRMVPRKGVETVVQALGLLHKSGKHCKLLVVGGESDDPDPLATPEIARLQQVAEKLGVADQIIFTGRKSREQLKYYYSASDIFVTTPWYEPFGITPLEAMACGTPVIGSSVGGIKYSVSDGRTGLLVPPKDPFSLADKISLLLNNEIWLSAMKKNAITRVNALFTWSKVSDMIARLYDRLLVPNYTIQKKKNFRAA
jgi:D-inositol-3-phosphate glycosyltransferase